MRGRSRWASGALAGAAVAFIGVLNPIPAWADLDHNDALPDGGDHSWCYVTGANSPNTEITDRIQWSMNNVEAQTIVNTVFKSSCGDHTDVVVHQAFIDEGVLGKNECKVVRSNGYCDKYRTTISWGEIRQYANDRQRLIRKTSCHEIGHSLGARHYAANATPPDGAGNHSCMRQGVWDSGAQWEQTYGDHHIIGHIDANWS